MAIPRPQGIVPVVNDPSAPQGSSSWWPFAGDGLGSDVPPPLAPGRLPTVHPSDFNHYLRTTAVMYQRFVAGRQEGATAGASERRTSIAEFASGASQTLLACTLKPS